MWRIFLFISLCVSITLNVYFFVELSRGAIENKIVQPALNNPYQSNKAPLLVQEKSTAQLSLSTNTSIENMVTNEKESDAEKRVSTMSKAIIDAINNSDFFTASFLLKRLSNELLTDKNNTQQPMLLSEKPLLEIKIHWLNTSKSLIQQENFVSADNAINGYLDFNQDDIDFLYQQIELYTKQDQPLMALKYAYELQYHVFEEDKKHRVIEHARNLLQDEADKLIKSSLWLELKGLVEQVMIFDPEDLNLQWLFVNAQVALGEFEYARNSIEPLLNEPNYTVKAQALLEKIDAELHKPESVLLTKQGEHFIVEGVINNNINVSLMIDTGASISLLSESAFDELNRYSQADYVKDIRLSTAGGVVTASIYQVAEFSIDNYTVNDFIFAVSSFTSESNDGLLGMNFLKYFDFHIDQENSLLNLKNK